MAKKWKAEALGRRQTWLWEALHVINQVQGFFSLCVYLQSSPLGLSCKHGVAFQNVSTTSAADHFSTAEVHCIFSRTLRCPLGYSSCGESGWACE